MDRRDNPQHTTQQQRVSTDNSHRPSPRADDNGGGGRYNRSRAEQRPPLFFLEGDRGGSSDDAAAESSDTESRRGTGSGNRERYGGSNRDNRRTVGWTAATLQVSREAPVSPTAAQRDEDATGGSRPSRSLPRPMPAREPWRAGNSAVSPLSTTVFRRALSLLVTARCQVNCHGLPHLSSSCPAAFSPVWTRLVLPALPHVSGKRRRHTAPETLVSAQLRELRRRWRHHGHDHGGSQPLVSGDGQGGTDNDDNDDDDDDAVPVGISGGGRQRSMSDSALQYLLMREVGRELRKMSDELHSLRTGEKLKTVEESSGSEEDSDDEM